MNTLKVLICVFDINKTHLKNLGPIDYSDGDSLRIEIKYLFESYCRESFDKKFLICGFFFLNPETYDKEWTIWASDRRYVVYNYNLCHAIYQLKDEKITHIYGKLR